MTPGRRNCRPRQGSYNLAPGQSSFGALTRGNRSTLTPDPDGRWGRTLRSDGTTPTFVGVVFEEKDRIPRVIRSYRRSDPGLCCSTLSGSFVHSPAVEVRSTEDPGKSDPLHKKTPPPGVAIGLARRDQKVSYWKHFASIRQIVFFPTGNFSLLSVKFFEPLRAYPPTTPVGVVHQ